MVTNQATKERASKFWNKNFRKILDSNTTHRIITPVRFIIGCWHVKRPHTALHTIYCL